MKKTIISLSFVFSAILSFSQQKITLDGYLNDMQTMYLLGNKNIIWENQLHRRLNLNYYPSDWLNISIQERTRFIQGNTILKFPGYDKIMGQDAGWADLSFVQSGSYNDSIGYVYTTMLDRAYAEFTFGNFVGTVGRQRINWGQSFAFNPNDIFNSYSYFDVDYPERPGSDAVRLQYYTNMTSLIEVAAKIDSANKITAAYYCRFNAVGFDIQLIGGILAEEDVVAGVGWSGSIINTSFRGEASYFRDIEQFQDTTGYLLVSTGLDYTFSNSLTIQAEVLYSQFAKNRKIYNVLQIFGADMNVKNIGFTEWSIFGSLTYPITPLINTSVAGMYFPEWKGFYIGPSFDLSLSDNVSASLIGQVFSIEMEDPLGEIKRQNNFIGYAKLKWSF